MTEPFETSTDIAVTPLSILAGDDSVSRERAKETISRAIEKASGTVGHERFDASTDPFIPCMENMLTSSLFQEVRIFYFSHAQELSDKELEELDRFFKNPPGDVYAVLEVDEIGKATTKIRKKLSVEKRSAASPSTCFYGEYAKPPDYKMADWLIANAPLLVKRRIGKPDAEYFADRVGFDVDLLHSELQKIDIHLPPNAPITRQAIETITGVARQVQPFELAEAVSKKDFTRALKIINALFAANTFGPLIIAALAKQFWALFRINKFAALNPDTMRRFMASLGSFKNPDQSTLGFEIGKAAGLMKDGEQRKVYPVIIKSGIVTQAQNFTDPELARIIALLLEFDIGIKTGKIEPSKQAFELLCYRIVRIRHLLAEGALA